MLLTNTTTQDIAIDTREEKETTCKRNELGRKRGTVVRKGLVIVNIPIGQIRKCCW